jgi:hypothetical protein
LITTWYQSIKDLSAEVKYRKMPLNLNNVDASVTVNSMNGITSLLARLPHLWSKQWDRLLIHNAHLIEWVLRTGVVEKYNSFVLLYYPPKFAFYWFVTRYVYNLRVFIESSTGAVRTTFKHVLAILEPAALQHITKTIMDQAQQESWYVFWDDFLGNADVGRDGGARPQYEDRVFSTAMATNALLDVWTIEGERTSVNGAKTRRFRADTPASVVQAVSGASRWLVDMSHKFPKENGKLGR